MLRQRGATNSVNAHATKDLMAKREPLSVLIIGYEDYDKERGKGGMVVHM